MDKTEKRSRRTHVFAPVFEKMHVFVCTTLNWHTLTIKKFLKISEVFKTMKIDFTPHTRFVKHTAVCYSHVYPSPPHNNVCVWVWALDVGWTVFMHVVCERVCVCEGAALSYYIREDFPGQGAPATKLLKSSSGFPLQYRRCGCAWQPNVCSGGRLFRSCRSYESAPPALCPPAMHCSIIKYVGAFVTQLFSMGFISARSDPQNLIKAAENVPNPYSQTLEHFHLFFKKCVLNPRIVIFGVAADLAKLWGSFQLRCWSNSQRSKPEAAVMHLQGVYVEVSLVQVFAFRSQMSQPQIFPALLWVWNTMTSFSPVHLLKYILLFLLYALCLFLIFYLDS